jgi:hypothetical protein
MTNRFDVRDTAPAEEITLTMWRLRAYTVMFAALQALAMVVINLAFEAVGSVPDIEGCGFIAGTTSGLILLYPLASLLISGLAVRTLLPRSQYEIAAPRFGAKIGLGGAAFYLLTGTLLASTRFANGIPATLFVLIPIYLAITTVAGAIGAAYAAFKLQHAQILAESL